MFERLTYRDPGEFGLARIRANHFNRCNAGTKYESITGFAPERLAAYEDTGLTPDEIAVLQADNERLRAENERLRALLNSVHELADAEKFEEVADMIDAVLPTIGRAALEGGQHADGQTH